MSGSADSTGPYLLSFFCVVLDKFCVGDPAEVLTGGEEGLFVLVQFNHQLVKLKLQLLETEVQNLLPAYQIKKNRD